MEPGPWKSKAGITQEAGMRERQDSRTEGVEVDL